ncbi:Thiosulfate dehydrogenase (quinone) large subunit, DoxX family protein [Halorhabdus sp. SVX81]|nr:Thiosulfate dehydrogenase (quinone) large subunit, DoxX family protein [Halorhabdus sp. SVX81]
MDTTLFGTDVSYEIDGRWLAYWTFLLRVVVGWWFFHAGITKVLESGVSYNASWFVAQEGLVLSPIMNLFQSGIPYGLVQFWIPVGETLIGLGLLVGCLVRLASFFGAFLMMFFVTTNRGFAHSMVNSDLMGLLLFITLIVLAAGRVWGIDAYLERLDIVQKYPRLRYLLG